MKSSWFLNDDDKERYKKDYNTEKKSHSYQSTLEIIFSSRSRPETFTEAGLDQRPRPEQAWGSDLA